MLRYVHGNAYVYKCIYVIKYVSLVCVKVFIEKLFDAC